MLMASGVFFCGECLKNSHIHLVEERRPYSKTYNAYFTALLQNSRKKDGRDIEVITLVNAPGLAESFAKSGITAEMYLTGQGGFLFSKLMLEGHMHQTGLMTSDMLTMDQVDLYFDYAKDLDITLSTRTVDITGWGSTDPDF